MVKWRTARWFAGPLLLASCNELVSVPDDAISRRDCEVQSDLGDMPAAGDACADQQGHECATRNCPDKVEKRQEEICHAANSLGFPQRPVIRLTVESQIPVVCHEGKCNLIASLIKPHWCGATWIELQVSGS